MTITRHAENVDTDLVARLPPSIRSRSVRPSRKLCATSVCGCREASSWHHSPQSQRRRMFADKINIIKINAVRAAWRRATEWRSGQGAATCRVRLPRRHATDGPAVPVRGRCAAAGPRRRNRRGPRVSPHRRLNQLQATNAVRKRRVGVACIISLTADAAAATDTGGRRAVYVLWSPTKKTN